MARACATCTHPARADIDAALATGTSAYAIAAQYGLTDSAVKRHKTHVAAAIDRYRAQREGAEVALGGSLHNRLQGLYARVVGILENLEAEGNAAGVLAALREARGYLETEMKLEALMPQRDDRELVIRWEDEET